MRLRDRDRVAAEPSAEFQSTFHWHVLGNGIAHTCIEPCTLWLNLLSPVLDGLEADSEGGGRDR